LNSKFILEKGEEALDKADAKIAEIEDKAAKASGDAKVQYQKEVKELKKMRAHAAQKLDDLKNSSADAWDDTKQGFTKAYEDLHEAYNDAVKKFK
jgi:F0F1-type ATP synthase membrane subunit b/b'